MLVTTYRSRPPAGAVYRPAAKTAGTLARVPADLGRFDLAAPQRIHVVGIGGAGMSAIAGVLRAHGPHRCRAATSSRRRTSSGLRGLGVVVHVGHDASHVDGVDAVTISTAIPVRNHEVRAATERGMPVLRRAEMLAAIAGTRRTIAVAGTHGKTTTSSMLALDAARRPGLRPSFIIGGEVNEIGGGAAWDTGEWFVVEADESDGTFLELPAEIAVVTSVEPDHLEHYGDRRRSRRRVRPVPRAERPGCAWCAPTTRWRRASAVPRARSPTASATTPTTGWSTCAPDRNGSTLHARARRRRASVRSALPVPGRYNALERGGRARHRRSGSARRSRPRPARWRVIGGVARRFEFRGERDGVTFVDDYAHLPGEVRAALGAAREGGWSRVVCAFQPHRYSRTASLWRDLRCCLRRRRPARRHRRVPAGEAPRPGRVRAPRRAGGARPRSERGGWRGCRTEPTSSATCAPRCAPATCA